MVSMIGYSHHANFTSSARIRVAANELPASNAYHANMARKSAKSGGLRPEQPNWYLRDWMRTLRVSQAWLAKECDWTNSTMHGIYHGRTSYYRDIVNLIASKLKIEPYELLMPPELAAAFKQFRSSAEQIVTVAHDAEETARERTAANA
jgi:hypothetical protein